MSATSGPALEDERRRGRGERPLVPYKASGGDARRTADAGSPVAKGSNEERLRVKAEELKLAARASSGDVEAFSKLVRAHTDHVRRVAQSTVGIAEAEDAAQEVWIRVWANMKGFRGDSAFGTWLHRVALNTCLDFRRRKLRREDREAGEGTLGRLPEPAGGDTDPEEAALSSERQVTVRVALDGVRSEHRNALLLRHVEGLSYADVAEILEVPVGTAKGWASRGRAAMLVELSPEGHLKGTPEPEPKEERIGGVS